MSACGGRSVLAGMRTWVTSAGPRAELDVDVPPTVSCAVGSSLVPAAMSCSDCLNGECGCSG